jgi:hypothetical protein
MRTIQMQTPTSGSTTRRRWARCLGTGATAVVAATAVASAAGAATSANPIGASGSVAAVTGTTMEVQNPSTGQTAVSWTPATVFSKTVTEAVSSITVGTCVTATGTPSKNSKTTIAARSITVTTANSTGSCTPGGARFGGNPGGGPGGGFRFRAGGGFPGGNGPKGKAPRSLPSSIRNRLADFSIASGKVTGVNGSTLTVSGINVSPGSFGSKSSKSSKSKHPTAPKTETLKVTTTGATTVNATQTAASTDVAVGDCVTAFGPAATNGAVTADSVRISSSVDGSCTGGFARFGGGGPGAGGGFAGGGGGGGGFSGGGGA